MRVPVKVTLCQVAFLACFPVICYEKWPVLTKNKKDGLHSEKEKVAAEISIIYRWSIGAFFMVTLW